MSGSGASNHRDDAPPPLRGAAPRMQRAHGVGRIVTKLHDGQTRIAELYQEGCAKIRLPKTQHGALEAALINTSGGLTGGDRLEWQITATAGTRMVLTTPASERIYKSTGTDAQVRTQLTLEEDAHVDWLPQETILFENARLNRRLEANLAEGATLTALEAVLLGREAMGEAARSAMLHDNWRIMRNGRLIHAEANRLSASDLERDALSMLAGNNAFATLLHVADDAEQRLERVRALIPPDAKAAASAVGERLIVRALAPSGLALRRLIAPLLIELTHVETLPRLWST